MDGRATATRERRRPRARRPPSRRPASTPGAGRPALPAAPPRPPALRSWLRTQSINVTRHAAALRPFGRGEFGTGAASPSDAHIDAANALIESLRGRLLENTRRVDEAGRAAIDGPSTGRLQRAVALKERAHEQVQAIEKIWDFYFELFGQRQTRFGTWLLACDRIALDCYQEAYMGVGIAKSIPAPPAFSYMRTGFSPATFRRGIPLKRLGRLQNPFPLIQLPYHRMVNPWTLGAVLHEVSHNLQNDLGLARAVPATIGRELMRAGAGRFVASTWVRWNREIFADLSGLLLGGPAIVGSLMDVVGRGPQATVAFAPGRPHPTPYLRTLISVELLRRMGFPDDAANYRKAWTRVYPDPRAGTIPRAMLERFPEAKRLVVDSICFRRYPQLGNRSLAEVLRFRPKEQVLVEEAARRLAAGIDPGVVPERFFIGAARIALERRYARPNVITENFYRHLAGR